MKTSGKTFRVAHCRSQELLKLLVWYNEEQLFDDLGDTGEMVAKMTGQSYSYFSEHQKQKVLEIIRKVRWKKELYIDSYSDGGKKRLVSYIGDLQYRYLDSIPKDELEKIPDLYRKHGEYIRKYGILKDKDRHSTTAHVVGPPLDQKAYDKMNFKAWMRSMKKYSWDFRNHEKHTGGITQHSSAFGNQVEKRVDHFYPLIEQIIVDQEIGVEYVIEGIDALRKGNCDLMRFVSAFKKAIRYRNFDGHSGTRMNWMIDFFIKNEYMDDEIIDYLVFQALHNSDPVKFYNLEHLFSDGINSGRGSAIEKLIQIQYKPEYADIIFTTVEKVVSDNVLSVKAAALFRLAYLNHFNIHRSFKLFNQLIQSGEEGLLKSAIWSSQYFRKEFFKELIPFFRKAFYYDSLKKDIATVVCVGWLEDIKGSYELINEFLPQSIEVKSAMLHVSQENLFKHDKETDRKCLQIFDQFLNIKDKEVAKMYHPYFYHIKVEAFLKFYKSLEKYIKSEVFKEREDDFFEYLTKCCTLYSKECLSLIEKMEDLGTKKVETFPIEQQPVKFIVSLYNIFIESQPINHKKISRTITLFDKSLRNKWYRYLADKALRSVDLE